VHWTIRFLDYWENSDTHSFLGCLFSLFAVPVQGILKAMKYNENKT